MDDVIIEHIAALLRNHGVVLSDGLSDDEVHRIETRFGFRFPPDLRALLQYALPVSHRFPDWRNESEASLSQQLAWPADGIYFDIEANDFWLDSWGTRPPTLAEALDVAKPEIAKAPVLVPVHAHRYLPAEPHLAGNPVFSVWQTDIIYYGVDLSDFFKNEFASARQLDLGRGVRPIRFWSELVELNNG